MAKLAFFVVKISDQKKREVWGCHTPFLLHLIVETSMNTYMINKTSIYMLKRINRYFIFHTTCTCSHRHFIHKKGRGGHRYFISRMIIIITHTVKLVHLPIMIHVSKMRNPPTPIEKMLFYIHSLCFIHVFPIPSSRQI